MSLGRLSRVAATILGVVLLVPAEAGAQRVTRFSIGVSAATAQLQRPGAAALGGLVTGAHGRIAYRRVALEIAYAQGTLEAAGATSEDMVDGELMLAVRALPWLRVRGGQHLRAFVTPAGTERWSRLELGLRAETELVPGVMRVDAELTSALSADVNTVASSAAARGGSVGVTLSVANSPVDLRLSYAADRASTTDGNVEFLQAVGLRVILGRR